MPFRGGPSGCVRSGCSARHRDDAGVTGGGSAPVAAGTPRATPGRTEIGGPGRSCFREDLAGTSQQDLIAERKQGGSLARR